MIALGAKIIPHNFGLRQGFWRKNNIDKYKFWRVWLLTGGEKRAIINCRRQNFAIEMIAYNIDTV